MFLALGARELAARRCGCGHNQIVLGNALSWHIVFRCSQSGLLLYYSNVFDKEIVFKLSINLITFVAPAVFAAGGFVRTGTRRRQDRQRYARTALSD